LANDTYVITRVDRRGVSVSPLKAASGYNNAIGVFVHETVNITCGNLRAKEQVNIQEVLFNKLFNRYSFNFDGDDKQSMHINKTVKHNALKMMKKTFSMWRTMANSKKDENFKTYIKIGWPQIQEEDWKRFVASHSGTDFKKMSEWGKCMRKKNKHNHKLGDCGYLEKRSAKVLGKLLLSLA
jgi:hypothetical protein